MIGFLFFLQARQAYLYNAVSCNNPVLVDDPLVGSVCAPPDATPGASCMRTRVFGLCLRLLPTRCIVQLCQKLSPVCLSCLGVPSTVTECQRCVVDAMCHRGCFAGDGLLAADDDAFDALLQGEYKQASAPMVVPFGLPPNPNEEEPGDETYVEILRRYGRQD